MRVFAADLTARRTRLLCAAALVIAASLAYAPSLSIPFFFDDVVAISQNPSIRVLSRIGDVLSPPDNGGGMMGRPLVNLSLALNYAFSAENPRGYHLFNLALHAACALTLFGLCRRTLESNVFAARTRRASTPLAFWIAILWTVHPLQVESVSCVIQRTELLVGFFLLQTHYCFVRAVASPYPHRWHAVGVVSCALGMASKEVMVVTPVLLLLYDRTFVSGSFTAAWRRHRLVHVSVAATWLILSGLLLGMGGGRGDAAGFGLGISTWSYALKQCEAIVTYLALSLWPHPLVLDYGTDVIENVSAVWSQAALVLGLVTATVLAFLRRPILGFLGAWFLVILAPSSSVVPLVTQTMAEHRMYLPLAAVIALLVGALHLWLRPRIAFIFGCAAVALLLLTIDRNRLMQDELALWADNRAKRPGNARSHASYGLALADRGRAAEAIAAYQLALRLDPKSAATEQNLGNAYFQLRQYHAAAVHFRRAIALKPELPGAHNNLGTTLVELGDTAAAIESFRQALRVYPEHASAHQNLARTLFSLGKFAESARHYEQVVRLNPSPDSHYNLGLALARAGDLPRAKPYFAGALEARADPNAYVAYARFLADSGDTAGARAALESALKLRPDFPAARAALEQLSPR